MSSPPPATVGVPVHGGGDLFPVRRIFCVGRNYAAHAREMGDDPDREPPFFFTKPADAVVSGRPAPTMPYPPRTKNLHHEMELVVAIGTGGADIAVAEALDHVFGYAAGLDMTRRDLQDAGQEAWAGPGTWARASTSPRRSARSCRRPRSAIPPRAPIELDVNGKTRQTSDLERTDLERARDDLLSLAAGGLAPGDLIFTGTPEGVAAVVKGDTLAGFVDGCGTVTCVLV